MFIDDLVIKNDTLYQVNHEEGRVTYDATNDKYTYEYEYRDHLGNLRLSFRDLLAAPVGGVYKPPVMVQTNDYDPWGLDISSFQNSNKDNFKYSNKERITDFSLGWDNFGARMYDAGIGRWNAVDPLADKFTLYSPYIFSLNNPLRFIDPDGAAPFDWVKLQNGSVTYDASVNNQAQAKAKYGNGATDIGKSGVYINGQGQQVNLNADGTATSSTMLNEVTVSAKADQGVSASDIATGINDAFGLTGDLQATIMDAVQSFDKAGDAVDGFKAVGKVLDVVGQVTGVTGAISSTMDAIDNPSVGNLLKAGLDLGLAVASFTPLGLLSKPLVGVADGILGATGAKDDFFKGIDNQIDKFKSKQIVNSQSIDTNKIRVVI